MLKKQIIVTACLTVTMLNASEQEVYEKLNHAHCEYAKAHYATARAEYARIVNNSRFPRDLRRMANEWLTCLDNDHPSNIYSKRELQDREEYHYQISHMLRRAAKLFRRAEEKYRQHKLQEAEQLFQEFLNSPSHNSIAPERREAIEILREMQE